MGDLINIKLVIINFQPSAAGNRAIGWASSIETENIFMICGGSKEQLTVTGSCIDDWFEAKDPDNFEPNDIRIAGPGIERDLPAHVWPEDYDKNIVECMKRPMARQLYMSGLEK